MGLRFATGAAASDPRGILIDLTEELDGIGNSTAVQTLSTINRGNGQHLIPAPTAILSVTTGAIAVAFDATLGRSIRNYVSAAAAVGLASVTYRPRLSPRASVAGAPPDAVLPPGLVQTFSMPVRRTVAGTARFQLGWAQAVTGMLDFVGTPAAAVWESDPAIFGGRWYPRIRFANAGAITDGPDSGIAPTDWHNLGIRFIEATPRRMEWLLDGVPRFSVSGDANLLQLISALPGGYVHAAAVSAPAGSTWQSLGARWTVGEA